MSCRLCKHSSQLEILHLFVFWFDSSSVVILILTTLLQALVSQPSFKQGWEVITVIILCKELRKGKMVHSPSPPLNPKRRPSPATKDGCCHTLSVTCDTQYTHTPLLCHISPFSLSCLVLEVFPSVGCLQLVSGQAVPVGGANCMELKKKCSVFSCPQTMPC